MECLAQWKEGSTYYFLGLISHDHVSPYDYEDRFRCFAYQTIFQVNCIIAPLGVINVLGILKPINFLLLQGYLISQSGDAQCTLHSATEGDKTMKLTKGNTTTIHT